MSNFYKNKRAIALVRVSSKKQAEKGISLPAQTENIAQFTRTHNIEVVKTVIEEGRSAYRLLRNRKEFLAMIEYVRNVNSPFYDRRQEPFIHFILVEDESRFFRNRFRAMQTKKELQKYGVVVIPVLSPPPEDQIARLWTTSINETHAEASSIDNSRKTESKMVQSCHQRWEESKSPENNNLGWAFHNGGRAIYGYERHEVDMGRDSEGRRKFRTVWLKNEGLELGKPVWQWARYILVDLRLKERLSYDKIRDHLNNLGLKSPTLTNGHLPRLGQQKPELWSDSSVRALCNNPLYTGVYYWNRRNYKDYKREEGKVKNKSQEELQIVEHAHPAIISSEEFKKLKALNRKRDPRTTPSRRSIGSRWLLNYVFYCKHCGAKMMGKGSSYVCSNRHRKGKHSCENSLGFNKDWVEDTIINLILSKYNARDRLKQLSARIKKEVEDQLGDSSAIKTNYSPPINH